MFCDWVEVYKCTNSNLTRGRTLTWCKQEISKATDSKKVWESDYPRVS